MNNQKKALEVIDQLKFNIKTVDDVTDALTFVRKLNDFAKEVEQKIKEKSNEIMDKENVEQIDTEEYQIKRVGASRTKVYDPKSVIDALGIERARSFLTVGASRLDNYLMKAQMKGAVDWDEIRKCQKHATTKNRKGYIRITKK